MKSGVQRTALSCAMSRHILILSRRLPSGLFADGGAEEIRGRETDQGGAGAAFTTN